MVYVGIYGGLMIGLLGWYFGRKAARKNRGLDEMYAHIWSKARSTSWYFTAVAIYLLMTLDLSGVKINVIPVLSILLFVHLSSWSISGALYSYRLTSPAKSNNMVVLSTFIGMFLLLFFVIVAAVTDNWKFLFFAIPPIILNIAITISQAQKTKQANNK